MSLPAGLQPHFDRLPLDQQIELVQELWQRIASARGALPLPSWHLDELERRAAECGEPTAATPWHVVRERLMRRLDRG